MAVRYFVSFLCKFGLLQISCGRLAAWGFVSLGNFCVDRYLFVAQSLESSSTANRATEQSAQFFYLQISVCC